MPNFQIYNDWEKFEYGNKAHHKRLMEALQFSFSLPDRFIPPKFKGGDAVSKKFQSKKEGYQKAQAQHFATLNDFPATHTRSMVSLCVPSFNLGISDCNIPAIYRNTIFIFSMENHCVRQQASVYIVPGIAIVHQRECHAKEAVLRFTFSIS